MSDRAVISLQLGHYSNFVGAHFWNLQESSFVYGGGSGDARPKSEICHDVLYREGQTLSREVTYTPRLGKKPERGRAFLISTYSQDHFNFTLHHLSSWFLFIVKLLPF